MSPSLCSAAVARRKQRRSTTTNQLPSLPRRKKTSGQRRSQQTRAATYTRHGGMATSDHKTRRRCNDGRPMQHAARGAHAKCVPPKWTGQPNIQPTQPASSVERRQSGQRQAAAVRLTTSINASPRHPPIERHAGRTHTSTTSGGSAEASAATRTTTKTPSSRVFPRSAAILAASPQAAPPMAPGAQVPCGTT